MVNLFQRGTESSFPRLDCRRKADNKTQIAKEWKTESKSTTKIIIEGAHSLVSEFACLPLFSRNLFTFQWEILSRFVRHARCDSNLKPRLYHNLFTVPIGRNVLEFELFR